MINANDPRPKTGNNTLTEIAMALGLAMTIVVVEIRPKIPLDGSYSNAFT
jgi:hypothetical protein